MRAKHNRLFLLAVISLCFGHRSYSADPRDFFRDAVNELLKEESSKDPNEGSFGKGPIPLAEPKSGIPPECHPHKLEEDGLEKYENPAQYSRFISNYFNKCSQYLTEGNSRGLVALFKFATTEYDLSKNPQMTKQQLTLSDGSKVEAYIGTKDTTTARPWVILKCGVFCDVTSSASTLNFVINFFDQSPFNVIFLSNHTGNLHIKLNSALTLGGFYEVYDYYDVAHWLKYQSSYSQTVDSIHAIGVSLGGSGAMAVSHLSNLYRSREGKPIFSSTTAICPVVNLGPTLNDMYADTFKGKLFTRLTWKYLKDAAPYLKDAQDYLGAKNPPPADKFPSMLSDIVLRYGSRWDHSFPPGRDARTPDSVKTFWEINHFSSEKSPTEIPTLAWASHDDHIVNFDLNTKTLLEGQVLSPNQGAVGLDYGDHCGFDTTYGFGATTAVLKTFILNNSPNFKNRRHYDMQPFPLPPPTLTGAELHLRQWWVATENTDSVTLFFETFNPTLGLSCRMANAYKSPSNCKRVLSQQIPIKALERFGLRVPANSTEAQILSRQLNGNARLAYGTKPIDGTILPPTTITWLDY